MPAGLLEHPQPAGAVEPGEAEGVRAASHRRRRDRLQALDVWPAAVVRDESEDAAHD